jgi:putative transposase
MAAQSLAHQATAALTELAEPQRQLALERYRLLRAHLEQDAPLAPIANKAEVSLRTAQRWVRRYRQFGLAGLIRAGRIDRGKRRRLADELRQLAEGLALEKPPLGATAIHRELCRVAEARGFGRPGYHTVYTTSSAQYRHSPPDTGSRAVIAHPIARESEGTVGSCYHATASRLG